MSAVVGLKFERFFESLGVGSSALLVESEACKDVAVALLRPDHNRNHPVDQSFELGIARDVKGGDCGLQPFIQVAIGEAGADEIRSFSIADGPLKIGEVYTLHPLP